MQVTWQNWVGREKWPWLDLLVRVRRPWLDCSPAATDGNDHGRTQHERLSKGAGVQRCLGSLNRHHNDSHARLVHAT